MYAGVNRVASGMALIAPDVCLGSMAPGATRGCVAVAYAHAMSVLVSLFQDAMCDAASLPSGVLETKTVTFAVAMAFVMMARQAQDHVCAIRVQVRVSGQEGTVTTVRLGTCYLKAAQTVVMVAVAGMVLVLMALPVCVKLATGGQLVNRSVQLILLRYFLALQCLAQWQTHSFCCSLNMSFLLILLLHSGGPLCRKPM